MLVITTPKAAYTLDHSIFFVEGNYEEGYELQQDVLDWLSLELDQDYCIAHTAHPITGYTHACRYTGERHYGESPCHMCNDCKIGPDTNDEKLIYM